MKTTRLGWLLGLGLLMSGCDQIEEGVNYLLSRDYDISLDWDSPDMDVDVTAQVKKIEDQIYEKRNESDETKRNYEMMKALCMTDMSLAAGGCEPARFPPRIPRFIWAFGCIVEENGQRVFKPREQCTMVMDCQATDIAAIQSYVPGDTLPAGNGCIDSSTWFEQIPGLDELAKIAQAVKGDLSTAGSLKDVKQVKKVTVNKIVVKVKQNSLTYDVPVLNTYVGKPVTESEVKDAKALINSGKIALFGTLDPIPAGSTDDKKMNLSDEGKTRLSDALLGMKATLAVETQLDVPPPTDNAAPDNCAADNGSTPCESYPKPSGHIKASVWMAVTFTVNPRGE